MFAKLVAEPVPYGYGALRATNNAERAGWGLVDIEAVNQALAGANPTLSPLEQQATIHIGHARGMAITTNAARSIPAAVDTGRLFDMPIRRDPAARRPMFELIPMDERR
jgi:hypothetical protein